MATSVSHKTHEWYNETCQRGDRQPDLSEISKLSLTWNDF